LCLFSVCLSVHLFICTKCATYIIIIIIIIDGGERIIPTEKFLSDYSPLIILSAADYSISLRALQKDNIRAVRIWKETKAKSKAKQKRFRRRRRLKILCPIGLCNLMPIELTAIFATRSHGGLMTDVTDMATMALVSLNGQNVRPPSRLICD